MRRVALAAALLALAGCGSAAKSSLPSFQRGMTLAHEVGTNEGYGSEAAFRQLARLKELGANSVTLVPYGFTFAPEETEVRWRNTDETDERVTATVREARRLGLATVLKPQLWSRRRWTGDIAFTDDDAFREWMASYRSFILHYARLAELERADLLVVGTELSGLTGREADWRALIREVRKVYSGPLTYAANWGPEFESVAFWDELDFLGVNFYYPLAAPGERPRAGSPRLRELERTLEGMSRRYRKPVLFTEVGYAASAAAAAEPWRELNAPLDPEMQARCYEVVLQSFWGKRWLAGLHWWKWPSHGRGEAGDPSFSPLGKPALEVLERWYGGKDARDGKDGRDAVLGVLLPLSRPRVGIDGPVERLPLHVGVHVHPQGLALRRHLPDGGVPHAGVGDGAVAVDGADQRAGAAGRPERKDSRAHPEPSFTAE